MSRILRLSACGLAAAWLLASPAMAAAGPAGDLIRGLNATFIEVMRNAALFAERHFVSTDVDPAIDRGGIAVNDCAAVALGQRGCDLARAARQHIFEAHGFEQYGQEQLAPGGERHSRCARMRDAPPRIGDRSFMTLLAVVHRLPARERAAA